MDGRDVRAHGRVLTVYVGLLSVDWCALPCLSVLSPPPLLSHSTRALLLVTAILGGFFVVNLFLAVIFTEFIAAQAMNATIHEMEDVKAAAHATVPSAKTRTEVVCSLFYHFPIPRCTRLLRSHKTSARILMRTALIPRRPEQ